MPRRTCNFCPGGPHTATWETVKRHEVEANLRQQLVDDITVERYPTDAVSDVLDAYIEPVVNGPNDAPTYVDEDEDEDALLDNNIGRLDSKYCASLTKFELPKPSVRASSTLSLLSLSSPVSPVEDTMTFAHSC
jgi:hypothetical protein